MYYNKQVLFNNLEKVTLLNLSLCLLHEKARFPTWYDIKKKYLCIYIFKTYRQLYYETQYAKEKKIT